MPRYRLDVGTIPKGGSVDAYWHKAKAPPAKLGTFSTATFEVEVPNVGPFYFKVYPKDSTALRGKPVTIQKNTWLDQPERTAVKSLTIPTTPVVLEDAVLKITPTKPEEAKAAPVDFEIRASEPEEDETEAVFVDEVPAGTEVKFNAWPVDNMTIHTRPIYRDTGQAGDWASQQVETRAVPPDHTEVIDNAGTSATGWTFETVHGFTPAEFSSSVWRNVAVPPMWNTTNTASVWGMNSNPTIWGLGTYFPEATITSPQINPGLVHEFLPVVHPEQDSVTTAARSIWDPKQPRAMTGTFQENDPDGDFRKGHLDRERRDRDLCIWNSATNTHVGPIEIEHTLDLDLADTGLPATYDHEVVHGHRYRAYGLAHRIKIRSRTGERRWSLSKLRLSRWIRNRKWEWDPAVAVTGAVMTYTFSPAPEVLDVNSLAASVQIIDTNLPANTKYATQITSLSATQIVFECYEVTLSTGVHVAITPAGSMRAFIQLMGI